MARLGFAGSGRVIRGVLEQRRPFRPRELLELGVSPAWIGMNPLLLVERLDRGVYGRAGSAFPRIVIATVRVARGVACLYSALWLHGLLPKEPPDAWVCIRHKAWKPRAGMVPIQFVRTSIGYVRDDLCLLGNWDVATTSLARTAFDFTRFRHRVGVAEAEAARRLVLDSGRCSQQEIDACAEWDRSR